jgi:uncharacterized RDD family membrane protein YckC
MKCPKCGYIGFEQTERCRNCGYDFILAGETAGPEPDLPLRKDAAGPFGDFDLGSGGREASGDPRRGGGRRYDPDLDPRITPASPAVAADLPLFGDSAGEDLPIVPAAAPTPPLAVRRSTPPAVRARPRPTPRAFEPAPESRLPLADAPHAAAPEAGEAADEQPGTVPSLGERLFAAFVDSVLLAGADAIVIYFTLKICRLEPAELAVLPLAPLVAFLVLLGGGYFAMLTAAGGQTLGKMAFGLKVVGDDGGSIPPGRAVVRTVALVASAAPLGLGLVPMLFAAGQRGFHDRLAGTRVVRVQGAWKPR